MSKKETAEEILEDYIIENVNFAKVVGKGHALMAMGKYAEAAIKADRAEIIIAIKEKYGLALNKDQPINLYEIIELINH